MKKTSQQQPKTTFDCMKSEDETAKWITNHKLSRVDFTIHELKLNMQWMHSKYTAKKNK